MNRPVMPPSFGHVHAVVATAIILLIAAPVHAQFDSAQVSGVAQDATGAVLPGVDVTLTNAGTGQERRTVTNETGSSETGECGDQSEPG